MKTFTELLPLTSSKRDVQMMQDKNLRSLLNYTWDSSGFYKELWSSNGIKQQDLNEIKITDLPFTNKKMLMENFDDVVTDISLNYENILSFLEKNKVKDPVLFNGSHLIIRSSGTSRLQGLFVYDMPAVSIVNKSIRTRMYPSLSGELSRKKRYAYFGVLNGNYAGETLARSTPSDLYEKLLLSVSDDNDKNLDRLREFCPDVIGGYSSSISQIAKAQLEGRISIDPFHVNCGGDSLSDASRVFIKEAWDCTNYNIYACSESLAGLAVSYKEKENFIVFDDLVLLELLSLYDESVITGSSGQVIVTNLYNKALPIIRYQLNDLAIKGDNIFGFSTLQKICGRENHNLPILTDNGINSEINSMYLASFFVDSLEGIQFVSHSPELITIKYQANKNISYDIYNKFNLMLMEKNASKKVMVQVKKVNLISLDKISGKQQLVVFNHE